MSLFGDDYSGPPSRAGGSATKSSLFDDDDNQTEAFEDDDNDSLNSAPVDEMVGMNLQGHEEEVELPPHACA